MYICRHDYVYIPGDIYFKYTHAYIHVYRDTYLDRQKGKQERVYSGVISQYKYFYGMHYLSLKVVYNK